jgi:septal ring factor EnvC (AmiA/AmiB activator)
MKRCSKIQQVGWIVIILFLCDCSFVLAQKKSELDMLREERRSTQAEMKLLAEQIEQYETALKKISEKEKLSLQALETLERQLSIYQAVLKGLGKNQAKLLQEIALTERALAAAEKDLQKMKEDFTRYAVGIYKFGVRRNEEILFSSASLNQAIVRLEYIKRFEQAGKLKIWTSPERKAKFWRCTIRFRHAIKKIGG